MRRAILPWLVMFGVALAAGAFAVMALNATVFGAGGFVRVYLDALARGDAASALELPGVDRLDAEVSGILLTDDALAGLSDVRQVSDIETGGVHHVTVSWTAPGGEGQTTFRLERIGTRFGLFPEWGFVDSPIATLSLRVLHDERFTVNEMAAETGLDSNATRTYGVLAPGSYRIWHDTEFLEADPVTVVAADPRDPISASLDVQSATRFTEQVADGVHAHLDECATQGVLFPSGCPIGHAVENRVVSTPTWSIVDYPEIVLQPGADFGTWQTVRAPATANLTVEVQSLFDGSISTFDEDVPFTVSYLVTIISENELLIVPQY